MRVLSLLPLLFLAVACRPQGPIVSPTAPACKGYCDVLEYYHCEEAQPQRRNRTCLQRCTGIEETGYLSIGPQCVVDHKDSLDEIRGACNVRCERGGR